MDVQQLFVGTFSFPGMEEGGHGSGLRQVLCFVGRETDALLHQKLGEARIQTHSLLTPALPPLSSRRAPCSTRMATWPGGVEASHCLHILQWYTASQDHQAGGATVEAQSIITSHLGFLPPPPPKNGLIPSSRATSPALPPEARCYFPPWRQHHSVLPLTWGSWSAGRVKRAEYGRQGSQNTSFLLLFSTWVLKPLVFHETSFTSQLSFGKFVSFPKGACHYSWHSLPRN